MSDRPQRLLDSLLALPAAAALGEPLRAALRAADADAEATEDGAGDAAAVLHDTLDALHRLGADGDVVAAAILDAVPAWREAVIARVPALAPLVDGLRAAEQVWSLHAERGGHGNPEGLRRLLLALIRDLRVVLILLARQLAQMRAATRADEPQRRALAALTRDIHAPLANRLGIWQLKWELEDLAFRYLQPDTYRQIASLLDDNRAGRERYIAEVRRQLGEALAAQGIEADVAGRPKHIFSIWKKMQKKHVPISELYDLRAVRVLVDDVPACYAALGVVHALWTPIPSEFDDYIARPKQNDYRSLHTAVVGPEGKTLEVQIRTHEMHEASELGVAAHWRYKETGGSQRSSAGDAALERKIEWMRRLLDATTDGGRDADALAGALDTELVEDRVFVLTPKGEVIDLPQGATPLDFAYHVHTMVGHRCRGAKVDGRIVPLDTVLHSGERVEILTGKTPSPRRDWLLASNGFLASPRSREKVRVWFHKLDRERNVAAGRELLEKDLRRLGLLQADLAPVLPRFNVATADELYVLVALGDVGPNQVGRALLELDRSEPEEEAPPTLPLRRPRRAPKVADSAFKVVGVDNLLVQIARCCKPVPGEPIAGYLTRTRGVTVHRRDCPSFLRLSADQPQRVLPVDWGQSGGGHESEILIEAVDRKHLLKDLSNLIAQEDVHVLSIEGGQQRRARVQLRLRLRIADYGQLARLLGKLDSLPGVERARRA
ncbi:bifunctional (p)ppGpp synthetase/guanosine-3',5'-bis(diphosphate) 3'-pyrophosphohydrolase [Luteimonas sp. BDR2-5]|uniref:RelA/SpoT family protein n=1 Tax=Proluteimonas luteida TaxID=2878685 RepID=UPI001E538A59|nr:bifunctional (p)ppGpp synthetase/guanosine-3',5'-bis(diphosphate) 3'-pyrophosphohydrolase [Luteimonas sp. BDR2-5]MCD9027457.1 bifunctional (p)ppGpp synthetase/guanosine-3',5'-bis(diphosphate) 3'-pyrophosphohydrolase [Luteimonas sp. BDR2-5]